jgi:pimeloyl-ACP methyl ester carboxylesterase
MVVNARSPSGLRSSSLEEETMHVTTVAAAGVDLVVREWGSTNGRPLLFWPGLNPWGSLQLIEAAPLLSQRGFRVCSLAAPGTGESPALVDADGYRPRRLAELVLAVADALSLPHFNFVGASWGGSVGIHVAAAHPERVDALVLLDGGYADAPYDQSLPELERQFTADQERFAFASWDAYLDWAREHAPRWSDALEERYRAGMVQTGDAIVPRADPRAAARALYALSLEPVSEGHAALGRAQVPTLLIVSASADLAEDVARFRSLVPQAVVKGLDAGHDLLHDAPCAVADTVAHWLG